MRGPNFTTGWAFPRCARRRVFVQAGVPLFGTSWGMRHVRICGCTCIYMAFLPRNCGFQYAKSPSTCAAACGPLRRAILRPENRFCSPKYHFRHLKLILDHTSHFRLLFHDGGRFPDDCSTEAGSQRLKLVWGLRNSLPRF
jgi:hypothetical protein